MAAEVANLVSEESARQTLRRAEAALDEAEQQGEPALLSQALAWLAQCHRQVGALAEAVWYAKRALAVARGLPAVDGSVDALCALAELSVERAARLNAGDEPRGVHRLHEAARDHAFEASQLAQHCADAEWEVSVLMRASEVLDRLGDHDDAITLQRRMIQLITDRSSARS
jgi:tetratricopeptide (TPR) repeat protein